MNDETASWLRLVQKGDETAFSKVVEAYQKPVFNLCYRMLGDQGEAEDAAQECFWRAYKAIKSYDLHRSFITWLLSIAAHYCIDQQRKRRLPVVEIDQFSEEIISYSSLNPENQIIQLESEKLIHKLLAQLKPQDRAAIVLRYWYDFSDQEIAQALSCSISAVKSRLHRARLLLSSKWEDSNTNRGEIQERSDYGSQNI